MAVFAVAGGDNYTLEIDDTQGNITREVQVRAQGIAPSWGQRAEGRGPGVVPSTVSAVFQDTGNRDLRDVFSGGFADDRYKVRIFGPEGPNGTEFRWHGWVKPKGISGPISAAQYPEKITLQFFDGLTRLQRLQDLTLRRLSDIREALWESFSRAQDLDMVWATRCDHSAGLFSINLDGDFDKINFLDDQQSYSSYYQVLEELSSRYVARAYLDPFSHSPEGDPRWKFVFRGIMGLEETNAYSYDGSSQNQITIPSEQVTIPKASGLLQAKGGTAFRGASVRSVDEMLDERGSDTADASKINNDEFMRDPGFKFTKNGKPLYGSQNGATVNASDELEVDSGFYETTGQYKGDGGVFCVLTYSTATDTASSLTVTLKAEDTDGNVIASDSASPANASGNTLDVNTNQAGTFVLRFETTGGVARLFDVSVKVYNRGRFADRDLLPEVLYSSEPVGILREQTSSFTDFGMNNVSFTGPTLTAPVNFYHSVELDETFHRHSEYASRLRLRLQPSDVQALSSKIKRVIGPSTRLIVEDRGEEYVMGGGRTVNLKELYTDLSDIQMLAYERQDTRVNQ